MISRSPLPRHGTTTIDYVLVSGLLGLTLFVAAQAMGEGMERVITAFAAPLSAGSANHN
ncbi:MAG TPA: hypothetical protein PKW90_05490 [Myxococcota bacterium]|nr:hypothetical protein [Myxococcota bacterium]